MKKIILSIVILSLLLFGIYQVCFKKAKTEFTLAEVSQGTVYQEVSETGTVKKGEEINISFKNSGRIEKIYIEVGQEVKEGDILAKLEDNQLQIQLKEAEANLDLVKIRLNKLLAGATPEEIKVAQTAVENAQIFLEDSQQNLKDVETEAEEDLKAVYEDALNVLDDSYLKIYNSFNVVDLIQKTYFIAYDQESIKVRENIDEIEKAKLSAESYLDTAKLTKNYQDIDTAISQMKDALKEVFDALGDIREMCDSGVTSTDKTSLDTQRSYINTALSNVTNSQQTVSSTKTTNTTNINSAQSKINSAESQLTATQVELERITASPRKEDIDLYQAQIKQAEAQLELLKNQIQDTILKSPTDGQVIKINKKVGEVVQPLLQDGFISLLPSAPFEIETDIYEEDVVKIDIGNPVDISLVAIANQTFKGKVISINPIQKLIEGVVYYEVTIGSASEFGNWIPEKVKPGMTADIVITTAVKENVLIIPEDTIQKKDDKLIVQVFKNGLLEEREIEIGLEGSNDVVEVISGLEKGEKVIIP